MDDLLAEFIAETREMLEAMQGELVTWEADPTDRARLDTIFRFVHTVKGSSGFFDLPRIEKLSHAAEGALADVRAGKRALDDRLINGVLAAIDRIVAMVDAIDAGEELPAGGDEELIRALEPAPESSSGLEEVVAPQQPDDHKKNMVRPARSIRLPVPLLDRVMSGISDIVLVRNELARAMRENDVDPLVSATFERLSAIVDDAREDISRMRMQRLEQLFATFPRMVRDLSAELGKKVLIDIEGGQVELDRELIELLRDPLMHILRNAIDHGLEMPAERRAAGKSELGLIHVTARQTGNSILMSITDDGLGIDTEKLCDRAVAAGILTAAERAKMSEADRIALIFQPGVSTAENVTSISGRGVGMDVVRANIESLGGNIRVTSTAGEGTRLVITLPATLSIIPALTVKVGNQNFGIPRSYVEEIVSVKSQSLEFDQAGDTLLVTFLGQRLRCCSLARILDIETSDDPQNSVLLMIRLAGGDLFGMAVDEVLDHQELVIKPLPPAITATRLYTGSSLLDDGSLVLMLYIGAIADREGLVSDVNKASRKSALAERQNVVEAETVSALLLRGLDGQRRIVRMDPVSRIETVDSAAVRISDGSAQVVIDGQIYPLAGTQFGPIGEGEINLLIFSDGASQIAYAVQNVVDTIHIPNVVVPEVKKGEIEGVTLFDGEALEVLDCHWLFAQHAGDSHEKISKTCQINEDDPWVRSILRPMVEAAGYKIVGADSIEPVDVAITMSDQPAAPRHAGQVITLTSDPEAADHKGGVIYRYDRGTLLASLTETRRKAS
ncbi:chemotaxis protein CheA [uncultured Parasphingorhabdus sp.]|uniref:chemotaxis protein CheA n=1 Tax=uncultured Parasphingorhabdus sp. TaxID=2709694 RepID=UPI0030D7797F|tara:strand:- start:6652 stop:9009 length:2358 start_codon:yes stop_codon:yes gene_type:complete